MKHTTHTLVWDPLLRIFHIILVACFLIAYFMEDTILQLHLLVGSTLFGLIIFRLYWGIFGAKHAKFSEFTFSIKQIIQHIRSLICWQKSHHLGHTPAGGLMIFFLLAGLLLMSASGIILYSLENNAVPFANQFDHMDVDTIIFIEMLHSLLADILMLAVLFHIAGVLVESLLQKQNLIGAMISGYKSIEKTHKKTTQK
ncbi:MAG: cytochrome b/b6 domain-containing protein [Mariprofundaceae bacterium]